MVTGVPKTLKGVSLQELIINYLEQKGWYFDWEHASDLTWYDSDQEKLREAHAWTLPQWAEYWMDPKKPEEKKRRYENLQQALWSQLLREEVPEKFACFFDMEVA